MIPATAGSRGGDSDNLREASIYAASVAIAKLNVALQSQQALAFQVLARLLKGIDADRKTKVVAAGIGHVHNSSPSSSYSFKLDSAPQLVSSADWHTQGVVVARWAMYPVCRLASRLLNSNSVAATLDNRADILNQKALANVVELPSSSLTAAVL